MCEAFQDMKLEEVKQNLCHYDSRNPNHDLDSEDKSSPCWCDNCFNGRTRLAEQILYMMDIIMSSLPGKH